MSNIKKPTKYPVVLQNQARSAFNGVRDLSEEQKKEYLKIHRRNIVLQFSKLGISGEENRSENITAEKHHKQIPLEHIYKITRLDEAYEALHQFKAPGGHLDYICSESLSEAQRMAAKSRSGTRSESAKELELEIGTYLKNLGYATHDNKKALVIMASQKYGVSESTVRKAARAHGLTRIYKK